MFFIRHVLPVAILSALIGIVVAKLFLGNTNEKTLEIKNKVTQTTSESADSIPENLEGASHNQAPVLEDDTAISNHSIQ